MRINEININADCTQIVSELQEQLALNKIPLLQITKDTGEDIMVQCPYHKDGQERKPSAGIRKSDGTFHCFTCSETHSLPEVISYCFGHYDDMFGKFGLTWILKNFATVAVEVRKDVEIDLERNNTANKTSVLDSGSSNKSTWVTEEELDKYRYYHDYMFKRKLTKEVIELFDVGYDVDTDCITFPVRDIKGNCLFVARRSTKYKYFNYPKGAEKPLYGLYEFYSISRYLNENKNLAFIKGPVVFSCDEVIVCESMIDALTCYVYGKPAVALNGLGNERQFKELRELPCRKLILATDADEAGMKARKRIRENVKNKIITEYIWDRNKAKDINDMSKEMFDSLQEVF